jgi:hypothetical protein
MSANILSIDPQDLPSSPQKVADWYVQKTLSDPLRETIASLKDKRICILGGCGQVGSHIAAKLYELGFSTDRIVINDDLRLGKLDNLPLVLRNRGYPFSPRICPKAAAGYPDRHLRRRAIECTPFSRFARCDGGN